MVFREHELDKKFIRRRPDLVRRLPSSARFRDAVTSPYPHVRGFAPNGNGSDSERLRPE